MKKSFIVLAFGVVLCTAGFGAEKTAASDVSLFNEINLAYKNNYYPGTVDKVTQLESEFPDSVFLQSALAYKGDALINMYRYDEAVVTLKNAISFMHTGSTELTQCTYLLGKAFYYQKKYDSALENFHQACLLALTDKNYEFYNPSVLYSGRIFYQLEDYEQAIGLFEYVISNGNGNGAKAFSRSEYEEVLQKLMLSYNKAGQGKKTKSLYNQLKKDDFEEEFFLTITLYYADGLASINENTAAYNAYCSVVESGNQQLAVIALKKAYILSSEKQIGVNPGEVFSKTVDTFKDNPELVNEFWLRLGIDEYTNKKYKKAEEYFSKVEQNNPVVVLYKAKILIERDKNPSEAEKLLQTKQPDTSFENFSDSYYSVLLQCKIQQKNWGAVPEIYGKIVNPDETADYGLSAAYYEMGNYKKVSPSSGVLYASALCRSGDYEGAIRQFSKLQLNGNQRSEYAKALFICGKYDLAYTQLQSSTDVHKEYMSGLCQINLQNWTTAKNHFANYIKQNSGKQEFMNLAFFYKGYAEYCLEEYKNSYASFIRFGAEAKQNQVTFARKGYEYAAKSALQNGDFKNAAIQAENIIKNSVTREEKEKSVLFCAEIFTDYKNYDRALEILSPYTKDTNDFAVQALFLTAKIYERQGNLNLSDSTYARIYNEFPESSLAEESMYRCGEVYYSHQQYSPALNRFNNYVYKYANGKFADGALFFGGESALKLNEIDRAIMLNKTMLQKYPSSVYTYGANKNLLEAYYQQESYSLALDTAKVMIKNYPDQAASDEIGRRLIELQKIVSGTDKRVAEKQSEYEKQGKSSTKKGRAIGTELVKLYAESSSTQKEAFDLAMELFPKQTGDDERRAAAENAELIADYYRRNTENQKAGEMYLKAAEYFRSVGNDSKAAASLYGAAEAFVVQGLLGDARETGKLLKQLYPDSRQAQSIDNLIDQAGDLYE